MLDDIRDDARKKHKTHKGLFSPFTVTRASCGLYHSLVIGKRKSMPYVYGWGRNYNNVLCLGPEISERSHPTPITFFGKHHAFQVSCGLNHTGVLVKYPNKMGGKVYTCGLGNKGRLGYTKTSEQDEDHKEESSWFSHKPNRVIFPDKQKISRISCGSDHTLAISQSGELFAWGVGQYGNLGTGKTEDVYQPIRIIVRDEKTFVTHCSGGSKHSLACTADGQIFSWGHNGNGRLGLGHLRVVLTPTVVSACCESEIVYVSAGEAHSACIDKMGLLYTFGAGSYGRLGHGDDVDSHVPRKVEHFGGVPLVQVACGTFYTMAVTRSGVLYGWGSSLGLGLLTEGDKTAVLLPRPIRQGEQSFSVWQVAVGTYHTIALSSSGNVFCWGVGGQSRLGHGTDANQAFPKHIAELRNKAHLDDLKQWFASTLQPCDTKLSENQNLWGKRVERVQCGELHTMILLSNGDVWVWGDNSYGQLGLGTLKDQEAVYKPMFLNAFKDPISRIACGKYHSIACNIRGDLFVWGAGDQGQLGLGRLVDIAVPTGVSSVVGVFNVFAGDDYSACLASSNAIGKGNKPFSSEEIHTEAGDLWTWGSCEAGKLGHDDLQSGSCLFPRRVKLSVPLCMVALGGSHMVACSSTGKVFSWGAGYYGRLGLGSSGNSCTPVLVSIISNILTRLPEDAFITHVYAGAFHSLALSAKGDLYVWGQNKALCSRDHLMCPTLFESISSSKGVAKCKTVATYGEHTLAVTSSGEVWAWGDNKNFQLGCDNKSTFFNKPELVVNLSDAADKLATSATHTLAVLRNNDMVAWGHNISGSLGIGVKKQKFYMTPTRIMNPWTINKQYDMASELSSLPGVIPNVQNQANKTDGIGDHLAAQPTTTEQQNTRNDQRVKLFLESLRSRMNIKAFSSLQDILKKEPEECQLKELTSQEDDLIKVLNHYLSIILKMNETEKNLRSIELQMERKLARVIMSLPCEPPEDPEIKESDSHELFFLKRLGTIKQLVEYFVFQPSYFVFLSSCIHQPSDRLILVDMAKQLYWNLEDRHINAVFLSLCQAICTKEIEEAPDLLMLFEPEKSNFMHLLSLYCVQSLSDTEFYRFFLDPQLGNSMAAAIEHLGDVCIVLDPQKVPDLIPECRNKPDDSEHWFTRSLESIDTIMSKLHSQLTFPPGLAALFKHAYQGIVDRDFNFDLDDRNNMNQQLSLYYPLVRLFLHGIVSRLFNEAFYLNKLLHAPPFMAHYVESNFRILGIFLNAAFQNNFATYHEAHLFREVFQMLYCRCVDLMSQTIATTVEEYVKAENTLSFFIMHFDIEPYIVTIQSDTIACLLNLLKQYEAYLQLSVYDPLNEALKLICDGKNYVFPEDVIKLLQESPSHHNLPIARRFLLREKNVVFDSLTGVPVPQQLAPRQQAAMREGKAVMALIHRYSVEDPLDPRVIIAQALRLCPPISANDWETLAEQFRVLQEFYTRQLPPDFDMAQLLEKAAFHAENFSDQQVSSLECCKWIAECMEKRQRHHIYLSIVHSNEDAVFEAERDYRLMINHKVEKIKEHIELVNQLYIEPEIREVLQTHNLVPQFDLLRQVVPIESQVMMSVHPRVAFPLQVLLKHSVIIHSSIVLEPGLHHSLNFTFNPDEGWMVQILETVHSEVHQLDHFEISNDELNLLKQLPRFSTISYGKNLVFFHVAHLLNFLLRASIQPSLTKTANK